MANHHLAAIDRGRLTHHAQCAHFANGWCLIIGFPSKQSVTEFVDWLDSEGYEHQEPIGPRPDKPDEGWSLSFK